MIYSELFQHLNSSLKEQSEQFNALMENAVLYEAPVISVVTGSVTRLRYDGLKTNEKGGHHDRLHYHRRFPKIRNRV